MTNQLNRLIDAKASQESINMRAAALIERLIEVGSDHEKRVRYLERCVALALGAVGMISTGTLIYTRLRGH